MKDEFAGPPVVRIVEGTWRGSSGRVVGIDQDRGMLTVQLHRPGITFGGHKGQNVEVDVWKVRRISRKP